MNTSQKLVVTGASQGIGAEVVKVFRKLDYRIVAISRSIKPSDDENILTIAGIYLGNSFTDHTVEDYGRIPVGFGIPPVFAERMWMRPGDGADWPTMVGNRAQSETHKRQIDPFEHHIDPIQSRSMHHLPYSIALARVEAPAKKR